MIDIHSHILPGIDDGARMIDESLEMLRLGAGSGTTRLRNAGDYVTVVGQDGISAPGVAPFFGEWEQRAILSRRLCRALIYGVPPRL